MTLCNGLLYLSKHSTIFSCSVEELLKSSGSTLTKCITSVSVWTKITDMPLPFGSSLTTLKGQVLAIGGSDRDTYQAKISGDIYCYKRSTNSWSVVERLATARSDTLVAVLPSNELMVVGGYEKKQGDSYTSSSKITEIANPYWV